MEQSGRTKPTKRSSGGGCQWSLYKNPSGRCYQSRHSMSRHLPKTDTRSRVFPQQQLSLRVWDCTHSHLLHAHFSVKHTLCAHFTLLMRVNKHAWLKYVKGVGRMRTSFSISPSLFSCFTRPCSCLFCCSLTVTSRPLRLRPHWLRRPRLLAELSPTWKRRSSALRTRTSCVATWPNPPSTQVMSPKSSTRILQWMKTRCPSTIRTTISPTSRKPRTRTLANSVFTHCLNPLFLYVSQRWFCSSDRKQRKHPIGKMLRDREKQKKEKVSRPVLQSWCRWKVDRTVVGVIRFRLTKYSFLMNEILRGHLEWRAQRAVLGEKFSSEKIILDWVQHGDPKIGTNSEYALFESLRELESQDYNRWKIFNGLISSTWKNIFV